MQWWNNFVAWFTSVSTEPIIFGLIVLIVAIIVASVLAAWISRATIKRLLEQRDREQKAAVIGTLVDAATEASVWNSLTPQEQVLADRAVGQADIQLRLLPIKGAGLAANWAAHELSELKRTSATFGYQLEPAVHEFRDRLIDWQNKPGRTRKILQGDLDRWKLQSSTSEKGLLSEQDTWAAGAHHERFRSPESAHTPVPAERNNADRVNADRNNADRNNADREASARNTYAQAATSPSTETQRLLDDVEALEVRASEAASPASAS